MAVGRTGPDRQQVVVARDVAVPGKVVRALGVTGKQSGDDADSRL